MKINHKKLYKTIVFHASINICFEYLLESLQWGDSNKYPKHVLWGNKNKTSPFLYIIQLCLKILYNSYFQFNGVIFETKCYRCNRGPLYLGEMFLKSGKVNKKNEIGIPYTVTQSRQMFDCSIIHMMVGALFHLLMSYNVPKQQNATVGLNYTRRQWCHDKTY